MAFNPDAYLQRVATPTIQPPAPETFNPDAFLRKRQQPEVSTLESLGRGAAQGLTLGFSDELVGAIESLFTDKTYQQARDESREANRVAAEAHPTANTIGEFAGGVGTALIPGVGAIGTVAKGVGAGGKLLAAAKLGAATGALGGAGKSEAQDFGGVARDAAQGGVIGGVLGSAGSAVGQLGSFAASKAYSALQQSVNPAIQRLLAIGASAKDLANKATRNKLLSDSEELGKLGVFGRDAEGALPDLESIASRVNASREQVVNNMRNVVAKAGETARVGVEAKNNIASQLLEDAGAIVQNAPPSAEGTLSNELRGVIERLEQAQGVEGLWDLKKAAGSWAKWDANRPTPVNEFYQKVNQTLNQNILSIVDDIAQRANLPQLGALNKQYGALATADQFLAKQLAKDVTSSNILGARIGDNALGGIAGTAGAAVAGAPGAAIGYGATALGNAALRSTEGRLLRAEVGQAVGQGLDNTKKMLGMRMKQQADAAAIQANPAAIPRTLDGLKAWAQQALAAGQIPPGIAHIVKRLLVEPPGVAETTIRGLMPLLTGMMTPSVYPSEFEGHVFEPQDRLTINKQLQQVPGLSPSQLAARRSENNATGKIPFEVYAPKAPGTMDDQMNAFAARLEAMGY